MWEGAAAEGRGVGRGRVGVVRGVGEGDGPAIVASSPMGTQAQVACSRQEAGRADGGR